PVWRGALRSGHCRRHARAAAGWIRSWSGGNRERKVARDRKGGSDRVGTFRPDLQAGLEAALDELVQVAVEHLLRIAALDAGAQILDPALVEHVVADLAAPADVGLAGLQRIPLGVALLDFQLVETCGQQLHRPVAVGVLAALGLAGDHHPRGHVGDAHRRLGLVDVLATGARGAVDVGPEVGRIDLDVDVVVDLGRHEHRGEAGVAAVVRIEPRLAYQPVHPGLGLEPAVGVLALDPEGGRLDARHFAAGDLQQFGLPAARLGPAQVHAQQHLGPVLGLGAAGARLDVDEGVAAVHLAGEHALELQLLQAL